MLSSSTFNNHRLAVIRKSIETNLNTVISNYEAITTYDYAMPVMTESDWYKILNNVSIVTFLQGMSIGYRIYNNYAVITNNINKEVVKSENIYIIAQDSSGNWEYHQPGCEELLEGVDSGSVTIVQAYSTSTFAIQSVRISESSDDDLHFYLHASTNRTLTGCYNCIVNATAEFDVDDIIDGNDLVKFENEVNNSGSISFRSNEYADVRKAYLTALARERNDLYKSNFDLSD